MKVGKGFERCCVIVSGVEVEPDDEVVFWI